MNSDGFKYQYFVKIFANSKFLTESSVSKSIEQCAQVVLTSKTFSNYNECYKNLSHLICDFTSTESQVSGNNLVVVTKLNPQFGGKNDESESWEKTTVMRMYVADAALIKSTRQLVCCASGEIKIDASSLAFDQLYQ